MRLSLDLLGDEHQRPKALYYNCRAALLDPEMARTTLEIAHWVLTQNGVALPLGALEYFDFAGNHLHQLRQRRRGTLTRMRQTAHVIATLWPTV